MPPRQRSPRRGVLAATDPRFAGWTLTAAEAALAGPLQVAIAYGSGQAAQAEALVAAARQSQSPGLVLAHGGPDTPGIPLLAGRPLVGDRRPPTCAAVSSATRPSPSWRRCAPRSLETDQFGDLLAGPVQAHSRALVEVVGELVVGVVVGLAQAWATIAR